jgi:regulator of nucleoside diphosphate kinase
MRVDETRPPIIISKPDYERLFNLVELSRTARAVGDYLLDELERAKIVDPEEVAPTVVTMESRFIFSDETSGEVRTGTLVFPGGENIAAGCISILTPVGAALLGLSEGHSIEFETRAGEKRILKLVRVLFQRTSAAKASS